MRQAAALLAVLGIGWFFVSNVMAPGAGRRLTDRPVPSKVAMAYLSKSVSQDNDVVKPGGRGYENGSANIVTAVVVDYRGFDTLGEVTVLFTAALAIALLLGDRRRFPRTKSGTILSTAVPWVAFFLIIAGSYIFIHGHLTPGGGFPGGAMIAAGTALALLSSTWKPSHTWVKVFEGTAGMLYVLVGFWGLVKYGSFLKNPMGTGSLGELLSGGFILLIYVLIGIKVGSELSGIVMNLDKEAE